MRTSKVRLPRRPEGLHYIDRLTKKPCNGPCGSASERRGSAPGAGEFVPNCRGRVPDDRGRAPDRGGRVPERPGRESGASGSVPDGPGSRPATSGSTPDCCGRAPTDGCTDESSKVQSKKHK